MIKRVLAALLAMCTLLQGRSFSALAATVTDSIRPVITGINSVTLEVSRAVTKQQLANLLVLSDNVSLLTWEDLRIEETSCDLYNPTIGLCTAQLVVLDEAGNASLPFIITITFVDDTKPVISGPSKIYKHPDVSLVVADVMELFIVSDNDTPDIEIEILADDFTGQGNEEGTYAIRMKAEDAVGNSFYHRLDIIVDDHLPQALMLINPDESIHFIVSKDVAMESAAIIEALQLSDMLPDAAYVASWELNEYEDFTEFPGNYDMTLRMDYSTGVRETLSFTIQVSDDFAVVVPSTPSLIESVFGFFKWIFDNLIWGPISWIIGLFD